MLVKEFHKIVITESVIIMINHHYDNKYVTAHGTQYMYACTYTYGLEFWRHTHVTNFHLFT